jgi:hypothetical protein
MVSSYPIATRDERRHAKISKGSENQNLSQEAPFYPKLWHKVFLSNVLLSVFSLLWNNIFPSVTGSYPQVVSL